MKKLLLGAAMMIGFASFSFAQTTTKVKKQATHKTVVATKGAQPKAAVKSTTTTVTTTKPAEKTTVAKVKKDGTPDKRFKANKKG